MPETLTLVEHDERSEFPHPPSDHHGVACVDAISEVEHDGRPGFGVLEVSNNPRAGTGPVMVSLLANNVNGLSRG